MIYHIGKCYNMKQRPGPYIKKISIMQFKWIYEVGPQICHVRKK